MIISTNDFIIDEVETETVTDEEYWFVSAWFEKYNETYN